jgi:hypothetical protein
MLSKCANPACSASFRYLHNGKLFRVERPAEGSRKKSAEFDDERVAKKPANRIEFFWLCDECSAVMALAFDDDGAVKTVPRAKAHSAAS